MRRMLLAAALWLSILLSGCVDKPTEHRVRANAYLRGDKADKALTEVDEGLKNAPKNVPLLIMRGKALFELKRLEDARKAYLAAVDAGKDLEPRSLSEAHLGLAIIAVRTKKHDEAKKRFQKLIELNPRDADARINLARVCLQTKDIPCALKYGEEAGKMRGNAEDVLFTLGRIYTVAKKYDEADKTFLHICEVIPKAATCHYGGALVAAQHSVDEKNAAHKKSLQDRAIALLKKAIALKMPNPEKMGDDPLLAPLKDNPGFIALLHP